MNGDKIMTFVHDLKQTFRKVLKSVCGEDGGIRLEDSGIGVSSYVYFGRSMNMENDLKEELNGRMRTAWAAFAAARKATKQLTDQDLCAVPPVRLHSSSSALLSSGDTGRHRTHV
ncbi:hypothetical protein RB195_014077 [Necator americanus]|uniref:Uncharacterized protein n=1 Tax=Necator americanus TaxID=51031 RepID=A0ABR1DYN6_NECAM